MYRRRARQPSRRRAALVTAAVVLGLIAGLAIWNNLVRYHVFPRNFGTVEAGRVYRSGYLEPHMLRRVVNEYGIRTIVDLGGSEPGSADSAAELAAAAEIGVRRYELGLTGEEDDDPAKYVQALRIMADEASQPVLVHCAAGADRTTAAVILYEHIVKGGDMAEALRTSIAEHRHDPQSNPGLLSYLIRHAEEIRRMYEAPPASAGQPHEGATTSQESTDG